MSSFASLSTSHTSPSASPTAASPYLPSRVAPHLYLGTSHHAQQLWLLHSLSITAVVNVTCEVDNCHPSSFAYLRLPVRDASHVRLDFHKAASFIASALSSGGAVLCHCEQGISRSPSVVTAYLMIQEHIGLEAAFARVKAARPQAEPNVGFLAQLRELEVELTGRALITRKLTPLDPMQAPPRRSQVERLTGLMREVVGLAGGQGEDGEVRVAGVVSLARAVDHSVLMRVVRDGMVETLAAYGTLREEDRAARGGWAAVLVALIRVGLLTRDDVVMELHRWDEDDDIRLDVPLLSALIDEVERSIERALEEDITHTASDIQ